MSYGGGLTLSEGAGGRSVNCSSLILVGVLPVLRLVGVRSVLRVTGGLPKLLLLREFGVDLRVHLNCILVLLFAAATADDAEDDEETTSSDYGGHNDLDDSGGSSEEVSESFFGAIN
jgi:hypothetical protein